MTGKGSADEVDGGIKFNIAIRVRMSDIKYWTPARIKSFFDGIAQAKAAIEADPTAAAQHEEEGEGHAK